MSDVGPMSTLCVGYVMIHFTTRPQSLIIVSIRKVLRYLKSRLRLCSKAIFGT